MVIFIRSYVHTILLQERTACHTNPVHDRTIYLFTNFIIIPLSAPRLPKLSLLFRFLDLYDYIFLIFSINAALLALVFLLVLIFLRWTLYGEDLMPWSSSLSDLPQIYFISSLVQLCSLAHSPQISSTCVLRLGCYKILLLYKIKDNIISYYEYCYIVIVLF
jgi:hypothetical protein